jgi:hypothetical protein
VLIIRAFLGVSRAKGLGSLKRRPVVECFNAGWVAAL